MTGTVASFDPRPLTEPVDRAAVRENTQRLRARGYGSTLSTVLTIVGVVFAVLVFLVVFGSVAISVLTSTVSFGLSGTGPGPALISLVPMLAIVGIGIALIVRFMGRTGGSGERWYRLARFAQVNGMTYLPSVPTPALPGMIFGQGSARVARDVVRGTKPRFVEFANYLYTTGSGKNRTTHRWGYVAVKLDAPLPHIVLDALSNNGLFGSNLPAAFDRDQRLHLEGEFDTHFALYCPNGYERDALYLFTPDIMARFIDNAAAMDVEIVDDWLFLYAKRDFSTLDPATWGWLFSAVGALLDKLAQWGRWRDENLAVDAAASTTQPAGTAATAASPGAASALPFAPPAALLRPPPGVGTQGRRLRRGVPVVSIVITVLFVAVWLFIQLGGFAMFSR